MTLGNGNYFYNFACDIIIIKNSFSEKMLGLPFFNNIDFSDHISSTYKLQIKTGTLHSDYQLVSTKINVAC